jgi:hypothetical protein
VVLFEHNFRPLIKPYSLKMQKKRTKTC